MCGFAFVLCRYFCLCFVQFVLLVQGWSKFTKLYNFPDSANLAPPPSSLCFVLITHCQACQPGWEGGGSKLQTQLSLDLGLATDLTNTSGSSAKQVSKLCFAPKAPSKAKVTRVLEPIDLRSTKQTCHKSYKNTAQPGLWIGDRLQQQQQQHGIW